VKVSEVMNKAVVIEDNTNLKDAAKIMSDRAMGSLIILKKDKIVGIVTERDIMKNVNKLGTNVSEIMSKNVIRVEDSETLDNAAIIMGSHKIKRLPVMHKDKLVGIITATDILANSEALNESFLLE